MKPNPKVLEETRERAQSIFESRERILAEQEPAPASGQEFRERVSRMRIGGATPSTTELERMMGENDLVDEFYLERALLAARPVCRIVQENSAGFEIGYATGFLISPRLLLTNWHVFRNASEAELSVAEFDFKLDVRGTPMRPTRFRIRPQSFYFSDRALDYALVAVDEQPQGEGPPLADFGYHHLIPVTGKIRIGERITIIQHPGGQRRQFSIRENKLVEKLEHHLWYVSDTAQGSSGAPAFNDSFQIVALHHSGVAKRDGSQYVLKDGRRVDSIEFVDDADIVWEANEGVRASVLHKHIVEHLDRSDPYARELEVAMQGGDIMSRSFARVQEHDTQAPHSALQANAQTEPTVLPIRATPEPSAHGLVVPIELRVTAMLRDTGAGLSIGHGSVSGLLERKKVPAIERDYGNRKGYVVDFLGIDVPMPRVLDTDVVSRMENGDFEIPYEHFTIVMHRHRRLALFTASNVDSRPLRREPEPGNYTRRGLGDLREQDREEWLVDRRIPSEHQLPDKFYNRDRQSFDKGHLTRRDDVCWGRTRRQVVRANGDTFHSTNCAPQTADFNRAPGIWGELEKLVGREARTQRLCVFSGPLFRNDDPVFEGFDDLGPTSVRIPRQYWKIVLAMDDELRTYPFVLGQNLREVDFERFVVPGHWKDHMIPLEDLEESIGLLTFPRVLHQTDQTSFIRRDRFNEALRHRSNGSAWGPDHR